MTSLFIDISHRQHESLSHEGLVVQVGELGLVGIDLVRTVHSRARIISLAHSGSIAFGYTALWIHTGNQAGMVRTKLETSLPDSQCVKRKKYSEKDLQKIGSIMVTTPERTLLDLLLHNTADALANVYSLVRAGCDLDAVARRAGELESLHGIGQARIIARQLPASVDTRRSDSRFDPTTR
ncbi:hypothetical protein [Arcanobacterium canis]